MLEYATSMRDQVEEVKQKTDIVGVIGSFIDLKKAGRNFKASCPFHGERTASFMVNPELQIFKCFGCGEGGDVFTFLEKYDGMEFSEALKFLAEKAGVKLRVVKQEAKSEKDRVYEINSLALKLYSHLLTNPIGRVALDYLTKERGISKEAIEHFQLGFSPNTAFIGRKFLVDKHKISVEELSKAGLVYQAQYGAFDRFRGRVIFPLHDHRNNVVGFAGRILPGGRTDLAKYINSPETLVYHKGSMLYGLNLSRSEIKHQGQVLIVEGELDLISSWQAGVKNVVALKGTAMTEEQIRLLSRLTQRIVLALDADIAGDAAARRGITIAQNMGMEVSVATFPGFKDPDEAARKDPEAYKKSITDAENVWDFIIDSVFARFDGNSAAGKSKIGREVCPILAAIEDKIVQAHYAKILAERLDVPLAAVTEQIEAVTRTDTPTKVETVLAPKKIDKGRRQLLEEDILALCFQSDPFQFLTPEVQTLIATPLATRITTEFANYSKKASKFEASEFTKWMPKELQEGFSELMMKDTHELVDRPDDLKKEINVIIKSLMTINVKDQMTELASKMKVLEKGNESTKLEEAERSFTKISGKLSGLEE